MTTEVYKLMSIRKNGTLGSLFINRRAIVPVGEWLKAEDHPTKGYAHRPGWNCTFKPIAPHLKKMDNRVWVKAKVKDYEIFERPPNQGGKWVLADQIKILKVEHPKQ